MLNCIEQYNNIDEYAKFNIALNTLETNIMREKHNFNSSKLYKELLYKSKISIDTFYNNYGNHLNIINTGKYNSKEKIFVLVNDINIYEYDLFRNQ